MKYILQKIKKMPPPGLRNIKTALAVFISLVFYSVIGRYGVAFAVIAVLMCMQDSVEKSIIEGRNRVIGTVIGAVFGIIFLYVFAEIFSANIWLFYLGVTLGLVVLIHICNIIDIKASIIIGCIVYLMIILGVEEYEPVAYAVNRTVDTVFGIVLAVVINKYLFNPANENKDDTSEK